jgi:hypothetical protein
LVGESDRFEQLRNRSVRVRLGERSFFVACVDDLIAMKQSSARPQGLLDIEELRRIQNRIDPGPEG